MANTTKKLSTVDETASSDISSANMLCVSNGHVKQLPNYIQQIDKNKSDIADMMLKIYPVGAIYISASDTNPGTLFGGTWEQIKGRFLVAVGALEENNDAYFGTVKAGDVNCSAGAKGGEVWHTLSINQMPSHAHNVSVRVKGYDGWASYTSKNYGVMFNMSSDATGYHSPNYSAHSASVTADADTGANGGSQPHNNMPPYLAVYMWKRTA